MRVGASPRGTSKASASEWAGSVETTRVRWPAAAQRTAVAAATVVLPTPPLPVNSRIRTPRSVVVAGAGRALDAGLQLATARS